MLFEHYVNTRATIDKWWNHKPRAFVAYVSENGHRQWPSGWLLGLGNFSLWYADCVHGSSSPAAATNDKG
eukprot:2689015-Amphidinium_carterae.2